MYEEFFGLKEKPFALTPNPRYIFYSERYRAAEEHLLYGISQREGFMLLTGMVGTGKTTLCRDLLEKLDPEKHRSALLFNPFLNATEMLQALLSEFGCSYDPTASRKLLLDKLNGFLLAQAVAGRTCIVLFDEAQHLSAELLEQIRVLSNLETESEKLLQIVLVGQPELRERIREPGLAQLDQRVSLRCTLSNLNADETARYIYHRLDVAGAQGAIHFTRGALRRIHAEAEGSPRLVNLLCDRALLAGYVARSNRIGRKQVQEALHSLRGDEGETRAAPRFSVRRLRWWPAALGGALVVIALISALAYWLGLRP